MSCIKNCEREVPELNLRSIELDYKLPWLMPPAFHATWHCCGRDKLLDESIADSSAGICIGSLYAQTSVRFGIDLSIAMATLALDTPFLAHSVITAELLALPGLLSLAAEKDSILLNYMISSMQSQWCKITGSQKWRMNMYEIIMKSDKPLKETLKEFDLDSDGKISCWECKCAMGHLKLPESQCKTLMGFMRQRISNHQTLRIEEWLDNFHQIYVDARSPEMEALEKQQISCLLKLGNALQTKKTFVEIFDELDKDNDGFISENDFGALLDTKYSSR